MAKKEPTWQDVKAVLSKKDRDELLGLINGFYCLNTDNRTFVHTKYALTEPLLPYKKIITQAIGSDIMCDQTSALERAQDAISRYQRAVGDTNGVIELMLHYVECGNRFTIDYGDINEQFYDSMESVFIDVVKILRKAGEETINKFLPRLRKIVLKVKGIGWGYYDTLADVFAENFGAEELEV